jgi:replicative DNA helicase
MYNIPPHSIEYEMASFACAFLGNKYLYELVTRLNIEDYYLDKHRIIFDVLKELNEKKVNINLIIVKNTLIEKKLFDKIGGYEYLTEVSESSSSSSNIDYCIKILKEFSRRRKIITENIESLEKAYRGDSSEEIIHDLTNRLTDIDQDDESQMIPLSAVMGKDYTHLQVNDKDYLITGIPQLDIKLNGIFKELFFIAARPSMGKTVLALNIAKHVAKKHDVFFFSLEQPSEDLAIRLLCSETNIEFNRLKKTGKLDLMEQQKVIEAYERLYKLKLHIDDKPKKPSSIIRIARRNKPRLMITDYLQLLIPEDRKLQRHLQVQEMTRSFKNFIKEYGIPHIVLCQLSRANEKRTDKRPILSDLRESGDIEQDGDKIVFIHRDNVDSEKTEFIIAKNRNGEVGIKDANFDGRSMQFI